MRSVKKNVHWLLLLLIVGIAGAHCYLMYSGNIFSLSICAEDCISNALLLSLSLWILIIFVNGYPTTAVIYLYSIFIAILLSIMVITFEFGIAKGVLFKGNETYLNWLKSTVPVRFVLTLLVQLWIATNTALRKMLHLSEDRFRQQADASILLKEAELFKLRNQLQPHFLYNSLNSINALILTNPEKAQVMVGKLSDFLRHSVKRELEELQTLEDELSYLQSYLEIESIRFGDRLQIGIEKLYSGVQNLPAFLLQPIIENAIKFGVYGTTGTIKISIKIELKDSLLIFTIVNPYDNTMNKSGGTGFGLSAIRRRLYLMYGRTDLLETIRDENTFTTILKIPQIYV